jgi:DNA-binding HxlR family transcriptional regulator
MYDYGEACPISKATQVLCERWTLQIIREMSLGASRFTELQKYLPRISPSLLTSRLKMLVDNGIAIRKRTPEKRGFEYHLTAAGKELKPVLDALGTWGMSWVFDSLNDTQLDAVTLMRHIAIAVDVDNLPDCDTVLQFTITDIDVPRKNFVIINDGNREYCDENPGHEVDVYFRSTLRDLSAVYWGEVGILAAVDSGKIKVTGSPGYTRNMSKWFPHSTFAGCNPRRPV